MLRCWHHVEIGAVALVPLSHITVYHEKRHHILKECSFFREIQEDNLRSL